MNHSAQSTSQQQTYNLLGTFKEILVRLPMRRRRQFWFLQVTMIGSALTEAFALGVVAVFASAVTDPQTAMNSKYFRFLYDFTGFSFLQHPRELVVFLGVAVMVLMPLKNVIRGFVMYWISRFSALIEAYYGERLLQGFLDAPYEWSLNKNTADLVYAVEWRKFIGRNFLNTMLLSLSDLAVVVVLFAALIAVQPVISLTTLALLGGLSWFIYSMMRSWLDKAAQKCRDFEQKINKESTKAIHGLKDVKISGTQRSFILGFVQNALPLSRYFGWQRFLSQSPQLILESLGFFLLSFLVIFMLLFMDASLARVTGVMTLLGVTAWRVLPAMNRIMSGLTKVRNALPYIAAEFDYLDQVKALSSGLPIQSEQKPSVPFSDKIALQNIDFAYAGNETILRDLDFTIHRGETLGIIGNSGAGKSTLVDLLIGLLKPINGQLSIDDTPLKNGNYASWISNIGYVSQSPYIYDGTLAGNIAFGIQEHEIDRDKVMKCCRMAAMDFLEDLPQGIDTPIGERGVRLSGGQQQRVAIARALYRNPDVLIFDEATSALDSKSEKAIQKTIYSFKGRQTLIIIAHRLSTVEDCDRILWLDHGQQRMLDDAGKVLAEYKKVLKS